jgi:hypothetical protein
MQARRLVLLIATLASAASAGQAAAQSALLPQRKAQEPPPPVLACPILGKGFFIVPGTQTCLRIGSDIVVETRGDFVNKDISVETRRLSIPVANTPVALYQASDLSKTANRFRERTDARVNLTAVTIVDGTPVISQISLRNGYDLTAADIRSGTLPNGAGVGVDQAFISALGFTAGLRPSVFDFATGLTYSGGYASNRKLNQLAYEKSFGKAQIALSVEDGTTRRHQDGVWANYGPERAPDVVLRGRLDPDWGHLHVAAAVHPFRDGLSGTDALGWAANAGIEYQQDWGLLAGKKGGPYGRFMLTAAYADGALDYLGIPRFATDYVLDSDGKLVNAKGASASLSYEHILRPDLRATAGVSLYKTKTHLADFDWTTQGALAQLGLEYNPFRDLYLGAEVNYYWDQVHGVYFTVPGDRTKVDFLNAMLYVRRTL